MDLDHAVKCQIVHLAEQDWQPSRTSENSARDRETAEMVRTTSDTDEAFRLVALRSLSFPPDLVEAEQYCYHAVAANRQKVANSVIWKYNLCSDCENKRKELMADFGMEQTPCSEFEANGRFFAVGVLAQDSGVRLKRHALLDNADQSRSEESGAV